MEWYLVLWLWLSFAGFSAFIGYEKGRYALNWFCLGLLFGPFGLLVMAAPTLEDVVRGRKEKREAKRKAERDRQNAIAERRRLKRERRSYEIRD